MLKSPRTALSPLYPALLLACAASLSLFVLHPRIGIRDVDAYSYVIGAYSLHAGHGYRSLAGDPFNHWPPGYSLMLSLFPNTIRAAMVIAYLSFGAVTGLLYYLLRQSEWSWQAAIGLSTALASGFFRIMANAVHPDILTYALFLLAICIITAPHWKTRTLPSLIWALLIPVKLIAVVFLPPALIADQFVFRESEKKLLRLYFPGILVSAAAVFGLLLFNKWTAGSWIPSSHDHTSLRMLVTGARGFIISIPREFLFGWHGSIMALFPRVAFAAALALAGVCILSLRLVRDRVWFLVYALACLACSALLLGVRWYDPSVRLTGYGLTVLFLAFRPRRWANSIWLLYGLASLVAAVVNARTVNSLGSNDPRYAELARQVAPYVPRSEVVGTNSFHFLDIHARLASEVANNETDAAKYKTFLWVTLPDFDPGASSVNPMTRPGKDWCEKQEFTGAVLFSRCKDFDGSYR